MMAHILGKGGHNPCPNVSSEVRKAVKALKKGKEKREREDSEDELTHGDVTKPAKKRLLTKVENSMKQPQLKVFRGLSVPFSPEQEEIVRKQFLCATLSANLPFRWVEDPEIIILFLLFRSAAGDVIPSRQQISGKLLDDADLVVTKQLKSLLNGQYGVLAADGWKDDSRNAINGVNVSVGGKTYLIDLILATAHKKDGASMCRAFEEMIDKAESKYGFQLILGDYFEENKEAAETAEEATGLIGWVLSHGRVRTVFDESQAAISIPAGKVLAFFVANMTRWTTHFLAFDHLHDLKESMRCAVIQRRMDIISAQVGAEKNRQRRQKLEDDANYHCELIDDGGFWCRLKSIVDDLEPICFGLNMNQADAMHPDQALLTFAGIFLYFQRHSKRVVADRMMKRIEKRWKALDQPMFVLTLVLNPFEGVSHFGDKAGISPFMLNTILLQTYHRVHSRPPKVPRSENEELEYLARQRQKEREVSESFLAYLSGKGEFEDWEKNKVLFERVHGSDPLSMWKAFLKTPLVSELADFAILLLSMSVNQAGLERNFSDLRIKKTCLRNRLKLSRLEKMAKVGADIQAAHQEVGFIADRVKRQNHDQRKVAELLAVPRYADLLEEDDNSSEDNEPAERRRSGLIKSREAWQGEMAKWIQDEQAQSDDDDDEVANAAYGKKRSKWLPRSLNMLFAGRKETDIDQQMSSVVLTLLTGSKLLTGQWSLTFLTGSVDKAGRLTHARWASIYLRELWSVTHASEIPTVGLFSLKQVKACVAARVRRLEAESFEDELPPTQTQQFDEALKQIEPICGKIKKLEAHLRMCELLSVEGRAAVSCLLEKENVPPTPTPVPSHFLQTILSSSQQTPTMPLSRAGGRPLKRAHTSLDDLQTPGTQDEFEVDVCNVFVACGIAWNAANNPTMHAFTKKWVHPDVLMPDRQVLSGRVLDGEVEKIEGAVRDVMMGKFVTGQCDGWKNVAKTPVITTVMTAGNEVSTPSDLTSTTLTVIQPYLIRTHDMTGEPKTGDRLLQLVLDDIEYMVEKFGVHVIAWCTDDGPDGKKMRRLLRRHFPWIMVLVCWAHQINLIVGDFLTLKYDLLIVIAQCLEVIKWFNNHGAALALLDQEMKITYEGKSWVLVLPVITRWTAHYLSTTRLLKVKNAVTSCVHRHEEKLIVAGERTQEVQDRAQEIIAIVRDVGFWRSLAKVQAILEPLAIAANITQASHTRLDHVLLTLGNLYRIYSTSTIDADIAYQIQNSLEKQWEKADQDIFILSVFFNPYIRSRIFQPAVLSESKLYNIVESVFKRFYGRNGDVALLQAFHDYVRERGDFSWQEMNLERMKELFEQEESPLDVAYIWSFIDSQPPNDPPAGRNALVKLAIHILTPVANSAGCERSFSLFGAVHTKYRNKLKAKQVHKIGVVKMDIHRNNVAEGLVTDRRKRKFGQMESDSTGDSSPSVDPTNFLALGTSLIREAAADNEEPDLPPLLVPDPPPHQPSGSTAPRSGSPRKISLKELFNYESAAAALDSGTGLDFYWKGGIRIINEEFQQCDEDAAEDPSVPAAV
ncbi:hypothetical protein D9615_001638 [Tricholomella constricta]|uniref:Uncharacterized protein n=1 Tax=Tricholomella constricta TaxID=117010 RepID=A0A8H5HPJ7_9AGAR|nr:hypothetical protein D9615_001638 [Tricholomella constricta]